MAVLVGGVWFLPRALSLADAQPVCVRPAAGAGDGVGVAALGPRGVVAAAGASVGRSGGGGDRRRALGVGAGRVRPRLGAARRALGAAGDEPGGGLPPPWGG